MTQPMLSSRNTTSAARVRKPIPRILLVGVLIALIVVAVYLWSLPFQQEARLRRASLPDLQRMAKESETARVQYHIGLRLREQNQADAAYTAFGRAAALDPGDAQIWVATAEAARTIDGEQAAFTLMGNFLKNNPRSAPGHLEVARLYQQNHSYRRAGEEAETATRLDPRNAEAWRLRGNVAVAMGTWAAAETSLSRAIALTPRDWQNQQGMGEALAGQQQYAASILFYREAVRLAPDAVLPALSLGRALLKNDAATAADLADAEKSLRRAIALQGDIPVAYLLLGQCLFRQQKYGEARSQFLTAQRLDPRAPDTYFELSRVSARLNDKPAADTYLRRHRQALTERNTYGDRKRLLAQQIETATDAKDTLRLQLARLLTSGDEYEAAIHQYELLLSHQPKNDVLRREMRGATLRAAEKEVAAQPTEQILAQGETLLTQGRFADAAPFYRVVIQREPKNSRALEGLGLALQGSGSDTATYYLLAATAQNPALPRAQAALGTLYQQIGMMTQARERLQKAVALDPQNAPAWHALGEVLRDRDGLESDAEAAFGHAAQIAPDDAAYQMDLAEMQETNRNLDAAEKSYRRAVQIRSNPESLARLGAFLINPPTTSARQAEAEGLLTQALRTDPHDDFARFHLGRLALDRGDARKAVLLLEASLKSGENRDAKEIWYTLGRAYQRLGDTKKAAAAIAFSHKLESDYTAYIQAQEQVGLHPKDAGRSLTLARALAERGQNARAFVEYERCFRLNPRNPVPQRELAALKARLKSAGKMPDMAVYRAMIIASRHTARSNVSDQTNPPSHRGR